MTHPGATSDFLAFSTSLICRKLQQDGFLAKGLAIYGDNAYVNNPFMVTPFKAVSHGELDAFNFHHSSLRITIECAFGMLAHRWGVLRKALPVNVSVERATQLVRTLRILHNFCINEKQAVASPPTARDSCNGLCEGGFSHPNAEQRPGPLMDGGHHFNDVSRAQRREFNRREDLPRDDCMAALRRLGVTERRRPRGSTTTDNQKNLHVTPNVFHNIAILL